MELDELKARVNADEGYTRLNGMEVTALSPGYCEVRAAVGREKLNPHGIAHGGLLFTLCDTAAGVAATTLGRNVVSRAADIHFLHPALGGTLTARGRVADAGGHMACCTAEVLDDRGEILATASFEMFFIQGPGQADQGARRTSSVPG